MVLHALLTATSGQDPIRGTAVKAAAEASHGAVKAAPVALTLALLPVAGNKRRGGFVIVVLGRQFESYMLRETKGGDRSVLY